MNVPMRPIACIGLHCPAPVNSAGLETLSQLRLLKRPTHAGKAKCKAALQQELGLRVDPDVPLLGYIGRLDWQKGPDCALDAAQGLAQRGCQTIMLGSGVTEYEQRMRQSEQSFPDSFRYRSSRQLQCWLRMNLRLNTSGRLARALTLKLHYLLAGSFMTYASMP